MVIWLLVTWQVPTLRHELCHARYALEPTYRDAVRSAWAQWQPSLKRWMLDLGYHEARHADEFGAYLLTEPAAFWRGRLSQSDVAVLKERITRDAQSAEGGGGAEGGAEGALELMLELQPGVPREDIRAWFA